VGRYSAFGFRLSDPVSAFGRDPASPSNICLMCGSFCWFRFSLVLSGWCAVFD